MLSRNENVGRKTTVMVTLIAGLLVIIGAIINWTPSSVEDDKQRAVQFYGALNAVEPRADASGYTIESKGPFSPASEVPFGPQTDKYATGEFVTSIFLSGGTTWLTSITLGYGYDSTNTAPVIGKAMTEKSGTYKCKSPSYFNRIKFRMLKCSNTYCHDQLIQFTPFCNNPADLVLEPANSNVAQIGHVYASDATSVEYDVTFDGPLVGLSGVVTAPLWSVYGGIKNLKFYYQAPSGPPALGQSCHPAGICAPGLQCYAWHCFEFHAGGACLPDKIAQSNGFCAQGLTCLPTAKCAKTNIPSGGSCDANNICASGLECNNGKCGEPLPKLGESCHPAGICAPGLQCYAWHCFEFDVGDPCLPDKQPNGFCSQGLKCESDGKCHKL